MMNPLYARGLASLMALVVCLVAPLMVCVWEGVGYKTAAITCIEWLEEVTNKYVGPEMERRRKRRRRQLEILTGESFGASDDFDNSKNKETDDEFSDFADLPKLTLPEGLEQEFPEVLHGEEKDDEKENPKTEATEAVEEEPREEQEEPPKDPSAGDTGTSPNPYLQPETQEQAQVQTPTNKLTVEELRDFHSRIEAEDRTKRSIHIYVAVVIAVAVPVLGALAAILFYDKMATYDSEKSRRKRRREEKRIEKGLEGCRFKLPDDPAEFEQSDTPKECPICMAEFEPGETIIVPKYCPCGSWSSESSSSESSSTPDATRDSRAASDEGLPSSSPVDKTAPVPASAAATKDTTAADAVAATTTAGESETTKKSCCSNSNNNNNNTIEDRPKTTAGTTKDDTNKNDGDDDIDPSGRPYPKGKGKHRIGFRESCIYSWLTSKDTNPQQHCPCCRQPFLPPPENSNANNNANPLQPRTPAEIERERIRLQEEIRRIRAELAEIRRRQDLADEAQAAGRPLPEELRAELRAGDGN